MKKPNQIRRNRKGCAPSAQPKPRADAQRVRVSFRMPTALHMLIRERAKRDGLTMSRYIERAVEFVLTLIERKSRKPDLVLTPKTHEKLRLLMGATVAESLALIKSDTTKGGAV